MRKRMDVIRILILVFAVLIVAFLIGGGFYLFSASRKLRELKITPNFADTELNVGTEYTFNIEATPSKASVKKVEFICDDPTATFEAGDDGQAVLRTGSEGSVTVHLEYKGDISSNTLSFSVVDIAAREAAAAAEEQQRLEEEAAAAEAAAAEEAAAEVKEYVKLTGDNVNVRPGPSKDGDPLGKAKQGEIFEKVEEVEDWTHVIYNGQDGYLKTEFLTPATAEEANGGAADGEANVEEQPAEEQQTAEAKPEEKKEEKKEEAPAPVADADADAKKKAEEEAAAAQKALEDQLAKQAAEAAAAAAAAPAPAAGVVAYITCSDGVRVGLTQDMVNKIHAQWDFGGDAMELASHHSVGDLEAVIGPTIH